LLLVVASSTLTLVPQSIRLVGAEILIIVVPMLVITVRNQLSQRRRNRDEPVLWTISRMVSTALATVPCATAGISLAAEWSGPGWAHEGDHLPQDGRIVGWDRLVCRIVRHQPEMAVQPLQRLHGCPFTGSLSAGIIRLELNAELPAAG
jgi:hypothetical protein